MRMTKQFKNISLLSACQALLMTNNSIMIATTGLAGLALSPEKSLATLPVTGYVCGAALTICSPKPSGPRPVW